MIKPLQFSFGVYGDGRLIQATAQIECIDNNGSYKLINCTRSEGLFLHCEIPCGATPVRVWIFPNGRYWRTTLILPKDHTDFMKFECESLGRVPHPWWHDALGCSGNDPHLHGEGICIGVIDTDIDESATGIEHVHVDRYLETEPSLHGTVVCWLIAARSSKNGAPGGVAPGAHIVCAPASLSGTRLQPEIVIDGINKLIQNHSVDIINLSFGTFEEIKGIHEAIKAAAEFGVLCIAAAGNEPKNSVAYPARYEETISVGAIGLVDWGSQTSITRFAGQCSTAQMGRIGELTDVGRVFHWLSSAYGSGLDLVAPGVGIVVSIEDYSFDTWGTSFAAPLVAGLLAAALSKDSYYTTMKRDSTRTAYAREVLFELCEKTGMSECFEGRGVPTLKRMNSLNQSAQVVSFESFGSERS